MVKRVYIDTSVFGGYFDHEFATETRPFFDAIREKRIKIIVSEIFNYENDNSEDRFGKKKIVIFEMN